MALVADRRVCMHMNLSRSLLTSSYRDVAWMFVSFTLKQTNSKSLCFRLIILENGLPLVP